MIKNFDYLKDLQEIYPTLIKSISTVLKSGKLILGPEVEKFEKNFSKFLGVKYGVGVGNCTDAIYISLKALNIGNGDEVITPANTAIPTVTAIVNSGASPRFVDVGKDYLIDCNKIKLAINKKTKAIIPVHLYGQTCNMNEIIKIAKKHKIKIIEDCAQSTGSKYYNKKSGSFGDTGCFSFYPTKVLGAYGDGGFISTNNKKTYEKIKKIRYMGIELNKKSNNKYVNQYYAQIHGTNSRLDELQAAILNLKLRRINKYIRVRQKNAKLYHSILKNSELILPQEDKKNFNVFYEYVVRHKNRKDIMKKLSKENISLKITYPYPIHKMTAYKNYYDKKNRLANVEKYSKEIFSLPIYPGIQAFQIKKICKMIKNYLNK